LYEYFVVDIRCQSSCFRLNGGPAGPSNFLHRGGMQATRGWSSCAMPLEISTGNARRAGSSGQIPKRSNVTVQRYLRNVSKASSKFRDGSHACPLHPSSELQLEKSKDLSGRLTCYELADNSASTLRARPGCFSGYRPWCELPAGPPKKSKARCGYA
jgi:hypothetical protein